MEQRTQQVGNELLSRINMAAAINAAQMQRIDMWTTSSENAHSAVKLQMEADQRYVDNLAKSWKQLRRTKPDSEQSRLHSMRSSKRPSSWLKRSIKNSFP